MFIFLKFYKMSVAKEKKGVSVTVLIIISEVKSFSEAVGSYKKYPVLIFMHLPSVFSSGIGLY